MNLGLLSRSLSLACSSYLPRVLPANITQFRGKDQSLGTGLENLGSFYLRSTLVVLGARKFTTLCFNWRW